jgi:hypothetical protein
MTMAAPEDLHRSADAMLRVLRHLPKEGYLSLIVLKGHLLIEKLLFYLVTVGVKHPGALESGNLSFYTLASVAKALYFEERFAQFWDAVFQLNTLRNRLAHNLAPADLNDKLRRFALAASGGNEKAADQVLAEPEKQMVGAIEVMCGFFIGLADRAAASRDAIEKPLQPPNSSEAVDGS